MSNDNTAFKQRLNKIYADKQVEHITNIEELLERVVESAADCGIDKRTISISKEELLDESINYENFVSFLNSNSISFVESGDFVVIDLENGDE